MNTFAEPTNNYGSGSKNATAVPSPVQGNRKTENVYEGPGPQSVFDRDRFQANKSDTNLARAAVTKIIGRARVSFFIVAAVSAIECTLFRREGDAIVLISGATCLIFVVFGMYSSMPSSSGYLSAMAIYGVSTTMLAVYAMTTESGINLVLMPLIGRGLLLFALYWGYGNLTDEHLIGTE